MPVIRIGGKKPAAKKTAAKPAARSTRKTTTASRSTAKKTTAKKAKPAAKKAAAPRGPRTPNIDPKILAKHVKALEAAGAKREKGEQAHKDGIDAVNEAAQAALADDVPMTIVSDKTGVSRQWLYKMGSFRGRGGNASNGRASSASRKTAAKKPAAKKTTTAKKGSTTRRTIRRGR